MSTNDSDQRGGKTSRLAKHLHMLGVPSDHGQEPHPDALAQERRLIDAVGALPALDFAHDDDQLQTSGPSGALRRSQRLASAIGLALAAGLTFVVLQPSDLPSADPGVRVKGDIGTALVYFERGGEAGELKQGMTLASGDRVRVELAALRDAFGYMAVVDRDSRLLTEPTALRVDVAAGQRATFPGALELTGESEGETILVLICPAAVASDVAPADVSAALATRQVDGAMSACKLEAVPLR